MNIKRWDAALNHPYDPNKVYLFEEDKYYLYNIINNKKDDDYPMPFGGQSYWPGIPNGIDAALNHPFNSDKIYFFKGDKYWRYDFKNNSLDNGYPLELGGDSYWPGIPADLSASYKDPNYPGRNVIFLQNKEYYLYDMGTNSVVDGYPKSEFEVFKNGYECPGCEITGGDNSDDWGVRSHFGYPNDDKEKCHLLNIIINCIDAAEPQTEIRVATCIWKDDLQPSEDLNKCRTRVQNQVVDGQDVLCALQRALDRQCKIMITKINGVDKDGSYVKNEYNSPTMNKKLEQFGKQEGVTFGIAGPNWNHFKGVMIKSMKVNANVAKYLGFEDGNNSTVFDVTIVTSSNLSNIDAKKYQDLTLSWNNKAGGDNTLAGFIFRQNVAYFDALIIRKGPSKNKEVITDAKTKGVGVLLYPRFLDKEARSLTEEEKYQSLTTDKKHSKYDPVVQFFEKFKKITSIKIAMAYWQGNNGTENKDYVFRRIGITDHLIKRIKEDATDILIAVNQLAFPVNGSSSYYYNKKDPKPQLAHYKENARSVPEFFKLRDVIVQYKNIDELLAPIKIVNKNRQQGTPYVHSKYMIIEGTPNNDMEASLKGGSKFIWVGSSNNDWFGAWNNAEITVIVDNQTSQGNVAINNYEKNFKDLMALGRVFHEKTKIHGSKQGIDMTYDYYNDADYNFGSRDIDNIKA